MFEEVDHTQLRYVLYARKSSEEAERQVRSINDQIKECKKLAEHLGLNIVEVLEESKSAKSPGQRPVFDQLMSDIRQGKYDGVLSWNPDRLSRNMLESGQIIDMVDQNVIKDLKFVTHPFSPDANGKMMLGIAFVLSKQYSDNLSQNVTRGVRNSFLEGRTPIYKFGYTRDEKGLQRPDGLNFELIKEAWRRRAKNQESIESIKDYLNMNGFHRVVKSTDHKQRMTKQKLSRMFTDPFYYGILIQGGEKVDLRTLYNFVPATTEEQYQQIQMMMRSVRSRFSKKRMAFYPLKQMVRCVYCQENMVVAPSKSRSGKRYLYFRCDTKGCRRSRKSMRAHVIFDYIYKLLEEGVGFTKKEYDRYYNSISKISGNERTKLVQQLHSMQSSQKQIRKEMKRIALSLTALSHNKVAYKINLARLEELEAADNKHSSEMLKMNSKLKTREEDSLTLEQFLNLSKNAGKTVKYGDAIVKDAICRLVFLNLSVDEYKVVNSELKEPFRTLLKNKSVLLGRGGETRTHDLRVPNAAL